MKKTILTADDSASMRQMVAFTLRGAGYDVVEAGDGGEAMERIQEQPPHLVITDLNMPNVDGIELIRRIRAHPTSKYVPIVMLTTESADPRKQEGRAAGATGWIVKPFRPEQLVAVAKKLLPA
ncbi:two-component system response regulator [Opitutaceae bacterium EW11]|nr:two-component system response regulator [Opitutaceae bacterium EW11]